MNKKHKCAICGQLATWHMDQGNARCYYYCDKCVKRGSISNVLNIQDCGEPLPQYTESNRVMWWDKDTSAKQLLSDGSLIRNKNSFYYEELSPNGQRCPSDAYEFDEDGFNISDGLNARYIKSEDVKATFLSSCLYIPYSTLFQIQTYIETECNKIQGINGVINYSILMSKLGDYFHYMFNSNIEVMHVWESMKNKLKKVSFYEK